MHMPGTLSTHQRGFKAIMGLHMFDFSGTSRIKLAGGSARQLYHHHVLRRLQKLPFPVRLSIQPF